MTLYDRLSIEKFFQIFIWENFFYLFLKKLLHVVDADAHNPKLTALQHLELIAIASGIPSSRVTEMLQITGLEKVKNKQIGEYSLGMKQRLGIAAALLGNPETVILDEPFNRYL